MTFIFSTNYSEAFGLMNNGCVTWLNSDEILVNFETYCTISRLSPFNSTSSEKWPHSVTRLEIAKHCLHSILHTFRVNNGLKRITIAQCRHEKLSSDWKFVHDLFTDPLITADEDTGAKLTLNHATSWRDSIVALAGDGQLLLFARVDGAWTFVENLTNVLLNYLTDCSQLLEQLKLETKSKENVCTQASSVALYYRRVAQFCSTKCSHFFEN